MSEAIHRAVQRRDEAVQPAEAAQAVSPGLGAAHRRQAGDSNHRALDGV
jgi:hypothetical protein